MAGLYSVKEETLQDIVNAVKIKTNETEKITLNELVNKIESISSIPTISLKLYRLGTFHITIHKLIYTGLNENGQIQFFELNDDDISNEIIVNNVIPNTFIYSDDQSKSDASTTHHLKDCERIVYQNTDTQRNQIMFKITGPNPEIGFEDDD